MHTQTVKPKLKKQRSNSVIPLIEYQPSLFDLSRKRDLFVSHKPLDKIIKMKTLTAISGLKS